MLSAMYNKSDFEAAVRNNDFQRIEEIRSANPEIRGSYNSYGHPIADESSFLPKNLDFSLHVPSSTGSYGGGSGRAYDSPVGVLTVLVLIGLAIGLLVSPAAGVISVLAICGCVLVFNMCLWVLVTVYSHIGSIIRWGVLGFVLYTIIYTLTPR